MTVSLDSVAALFLERQHLGRPRHRRLTTRRLVDFVGSAGGLQLDSINVVCRAHYLTLFSRFGSYDPGFVDRVAYRRRLFFEYWAHAACLIPRDDFQAWRRIMVEYGHHARSWSAWPKKYDPLLTEVENAIRERGPLGSADFEGQTNSLASGGWWNWKPTTRALDYLWMSGRTMVHSRRHFHKRYDLPDRVLPELATCEPPSLEEFGRWHVRRSLFAMGAATEADLRMYLSFPKPSHLDRRRALREMVASREVVEIPVEHRGPGKPPRWFILAADQPAIARAGRRRRASVGTTLLCPFDSFLWHRDRTRRLFGFDYTIEVYTPGHKRKHGYYTLPILHDGQLVGRVDTKTHREERTLELRHVHFEPWVLGRAEPPTVRGSEVALDRVLEGVADAARDLARFVGADRVEVGRVSPGRLASPLRRLASRLG
ncbi:MAG: winged helix-turn-helix domain-containing protein [Gemmatimonadales bacterium]